MTKADVQPLTVPELMVLAGRGIGKVDLFGRRGATLVTVEEIEAMACALALLGVAPVMPGTYPTANHINHTEGERA